MSDTIQATVTFPLAAAPFHHKYDPQTTVAVVCKEAMAAFGASEDQTVRFYLSHDGVRLSDTIVLRDIHEHAHGLKFILVKELIQG